MGIIDFSFPPLSEFQPGGSEDHHGSDDLKKEESTIMLKPFKITCRYRQQHLSRATDRQISAFDSHSSMDRGTKSGHKSMWLPYKKG